jgi:hypothetical protein
VSADVGSWVLEQAGGVAQLFRDVWDLLVVFTAEHSLLVGIFCAVVLLMVGHEWLEDRRQRRQPAGEADVLGGLSSGDRDHDRWHVQTGIPAGSAVCVRCCDYRNAQGWAA